MNCYVWIRLKMAEWVFVRSVSPFVRVNRNYLVAAYAPRALGDWHSGTEHVLTPDSQGRKSKGCHHRRAKERTTGYGLK